MIETLKIVIPFILGLIPFIITLMVDLKSEKESAKEKYRIKFYEIQLNLFNELSQDLSKINTSLYTITLLYYGVDDSDENKDEDQKNTFFLSPQGVRQR